MNNETKKCPYCGEEILSVAKKCRHCGEWLKESPKNKSIKINKKVVISILSLILILIFSVIFFFTKKYFDLRDPLNVTYDNIKQEVNAENVDLYGALLAISNMEKDIEYYLMGNHSQKNKDKLFLLFLRNIHEYSDAAAVDVSDYLDTYNVSNINRTFSTEYDVKFNYRQVEDGIYYERELKLLSPSLKSIKYVYKGEGVQGPEINYKTLNNLYSQYLSKKMQDYLKIKCIEETDLNGRGYFAYGSGAAVSSDKLVDWVVYWQDFLKKYPNFYMRKQIKNNLEWYTSEIIRTKYGTFDYPDYQNNSNVIKLNKYARNAYEKALTNFNKHSEEYKNVKKCYDFMKKTDFKTTYDEFDKVCGKAAHYSGAGYFEDY